MKKANSTGNEKLNFEIAKGNYHSRLIHVGSSFGCPEYIYAFCDDSMWPAFLGVCMYKNLTLGNTLYSGTVRFLSILII